MIKLTQLLTEGKGDCYQAGGRLIFNYFGDKNAKLVHGMVSGQGALEGSRFGHCWVESKDTVLDHSNGKKRELPKAVYYNLGNINADECHYYTPEEASKWMLKSKHWGPWEMSGDTVMAEEIPDSKVEMGKHNLRIKPEDLEKIQTFL